MTEHDALTRPFEDNRAHLRAVAYRMLGSLSDADDAVQKAWLKLSAADTGDVANLKGWLTTVVARVCLDMLRTRKSRAEETLDAQAPGVEADAGQSDPEQEAVLADSVGLALLVVLETLAPAERLAFVLHDLFAMSFDEIAPIVGRTPVAARQLASRARRRVQGARRVRDADVDRQKQVVDAYLAAARGGDFGALLAVLDPDVVVRTDRAVPGGAPPGVLRGADAVARNALRARARFARPVLVNGTVGVVVAPFGRLLLVLRFTITRGKVVEIDVVAEPERLRQLELSVI